MKNSKGFTIVEIITVLVIITLIATMAIAGISGARGRIDNRAYNSKVKLIEQAAREYAKENSEKIKEEYGECTETSGHCDCSGDKCVYKFNTTVEELIELGYYDPEDNDECLVTNPRDKSKCFDKEPIEIIIDADQKDVDAHFGEEFDPYDTISPENKLCDLIVEGTEGTNGWYIGENNKLILVFKKEGVTPVKYGISKSSEKWYNDLREMPLSSTTGSTYYGYVKYEDGTEGSCVIKNIKVDATNPTDPNIEITNTPELVFSGSRDTYSERVKYSYKIGDADYSIGTKYKIPSSLESTSVNLYSFDYAGNKSNTISKQLTVEDAINGTITQTITYHCPSGYTCSTNPCKSTSTCTKTEEELPTETKKYKCDLTGEVYETETEAINNCFTHESGTIVTTSNYVCPSGYTCSDNPCKSTSTCTKLESSTTPISDTYYLCYVDDEYIGTFTSESEATSNCKKTIYGNITSTTTYHCPSGYTCSTIPCKSTSTCKKETEPIVTSVDYTCSFDGMIVAIYDNYEEAVAYCNDSEYGEIGTKDIYSCPSGYTCSDGSNCNSSSTCKKTETKTPSYTTKYTCSLHTGTLYDTETAAKNACKDTQTVSKQFSYIAKCNKTGSYYTYAFTSETRTGTALTSCTENTVSSCNASNYGKVNKRCSSYTKWILVGLCKNKESHKVYPIETERFNSSAACQERANNYKCEGLLEIPEAIGCDKETYYSKWEKTCSRTLHNTYTYGSYSCDTSVNSSCEPSCPSGYTKGTVSRSKCINEVNGQSCSSNKTCTATTTVVCSKTGTTGSVKIYSCPSGYTCSGSSCTSSSTCTKVSTTSVNTTKKYTCSFNSNLYATEAEARNACQRNLPGDIIERKKYGCPSGYTCSSSYCTATSKCTMSDKSKLYGTNKYKCSLNNQSYDSQSEAEAACQTEEDGIVTTKRTYGCQAGYVCSDGDNCNSNSTCLKYTNQNSINQPKYYCTLTDQYYNSQVEAAGSCYRNIRGEVSDTYIYSCIKPFNCNSSPCTIDSKCIKRTNKRTEYTTVFYCSADTGTEYLDGDNVYDRCENYCRNDGKYNLTTKKCYILE